MLFWCNFTFDVQGPLAGIGTIGTTAATDESVQRIDLEQVGKTVLPCKLQADVVIQAPAADGARLNNNGCASASPKASSNEFDLHI